MRFFIIAIVAAGISFGCKKKSVEEPVPLSEIPECHATENLDSSAIVNRLTGNWKLTYRFCGWSGEASLDTLVVIARLKSNHTYTVAENGTTVSQGNWAIKKANYNLWMFEMADYNTYLQGYIQLCQNQLLVENIYVDGCNNLFKKIP